MGDTILIGTKSAKHYFADTHPDLKVLDGPVALYADGKGIFIAPEYDRIVVECDPDPTDELHINHAIFVDVVQLEHDCKDIRTYTMNVDDREHKRYLLPEYRMAFKEAPFIIMDSLKTLDLIRPTE